MLDILSRNERESVLHRFFSIQANKQNKHTNYETFTLHFRLKKLRLSSEDFAFLENKKAGLFPTFEPKSNCKNFLQLHIF